MPPPFASPVSVVGFQVQQAMGVLQQAVVAQNVGVIPSATSPLSVLQAVEAVPGIIAPPDAARIRELIQQGNSGEAFQRLGAYQDVLAVVHQECVAGMPAAATLPLERIAALFGLVTQDFSPLVLGSEERVRPFSPVAPLDPSAASRVELQFSDGSCHRFALAKNGESASGFPLSIRFGREGTSGVVLADASVSGKHAEIGFVNGRYCIEDSKSTNGTYVNGIRLSSYERRVLKDGDCIRIGRYEMTIRLPYELRLRDLTARLKDAASYPKVFEALGAAGFGHIAPAILDALSARGLVGERLRLLRDAAPYDGGLLVKLEAFLLRGEVVRLRSVFFPRLTPAQALETGTRLAASLAQAQTFADLAERLRLTNPEAFAGEIAGIEMLHRFTLGYRAENIRLSDFPDTFGLKTQVYRLFMEALSLDSNQRQDLQWRGVTPDILLERPWRRIQVSPLLSKALEPFRSVIGQRLNLEDMEKTIVNSFSDETDSPSVVPQEDKGLATQHVLYKEYQAEKPTGSLLTDTGTESRRPGFFERAAERMLQDRVPIHQDGYWFFGGTFHFDNRLEGRIYLSLRRRHAEAIFRYLHGVIEKTVKAKNGEIQYKIAGNAEGYSRSDSGVIYFHAKDQETIYKAVRDMSLAHPEFFKEGHPHFTMPLRDESGAVLTGLSFGEHPEYSGESFGSQRTQAMTTAVRVARALMKTAEPPDWNEIRQICAYFLKRAGVDLENPAFREGGAEKFGFLIRQCRERAVPPPAPAMDAEKMKAAIASEILQRYPGLGIPAAANLVKSIAKLMYGAWTKSGRFPGVSADAPSYLPEDIFEAKMADVLREIEKDRSHPNMEAFHQAIAVDDQGPRALRGLTSRLRSGCPMFRDPKNENLLHSLAKNIHKAWLASSQSAADLDKIFRGRIAFLVDHLEKTAQGDPFSLRLKAELQTLLG